VLRLLVGFYVELIRNTPLLVQIFIVYFGLSSVGLKLSAETSAVIALVVNMGAYTTEIMRAGIQSIHRTQLEAADCLGLTRLQTILHVVLLPAIERVYPALSSQFVLLMLASSITSQISAEELTAVANNVQSDTYRSFEVYIIVAAIYLALSLLYRLAFKAIGLIIFERRRRLGTAL
jgi:polar amino acid transport system permease protein